MKIPLFKIYWDKEDITAVTKAIKLGRDWAIGANIAKFEEITAKYVGTKYAVVFNSGTSALQAILNAFGIGKGDEVIVPSFTFIATANAPLFVDAKPIFADIEEDCLGLDPKDVQRKITKKTRAIIPIHYAGMPCKIRELRKVAQDYNLILIEDTAESLGAKIGEKMTGTFGQAAILSFCASKIITTGEGGAVLTNSKKIYERLKLIRSHGRAENNNYFTSCEYMDYVDLGYNFRMSNLLAALGIAQFKKIEKIIQLRREKAAYLTKRLNQEVREIITFKPLPDYYCVYQMYPVRTEFRDQLMRYLAKKGIMTKVYFHPVHLTAFYRRKLQYQCKLPVTEKIASQILSFPIYPTLTKKEMDYTIKEIKKFFQYEI